MKVLYYVLIHMCFYSTGLAVTRGMVTAIQFLLTDMMWFLTSITLNGFVVRDSSLIHGFDVFVSSSVVERGLWYT